MRLSNRKETKAIPAIYYFSVVIFFLLIFLYYEFGNAMFGSKIIFFGILLSIIIIQIYIYTCGMYFEYDSDKNLLNIANKGMVLSNFIDYRNKKVKVKRDEIINYKIYNFIIYRKLVIEAKDSKGKQYKRHINLTFLKPKKFKLVKKSLDRFIRKKQVEKA
jgi:hypothetical protein